MNEAVKNKLLAKEILKGEFICKVKNIVAPNELYISSVTDFLQFY